MKHSPIFLLMAFLIASFGFGPGGVAVSADIENPDASLLAPDAPEREVLKRTLYLTGGEGDCSGTWIEPGVVISADHCSPLIEKGPDGRPVLKVGGIPVAVNYLSSVSADAADGAVLRKADVLVLGVDAEPLAPLGLPAEPLALPSPDPVGLEKGVRLLVAGHGADSLAFDRKGYIAVDYSMVGKHPLGAAWVESGQTNSARDYIVFTAARKARTRLDCAAGQSFWTEHGPGSCWFQTSVDPTDHRDPAIQSGDSGGPVFRRERGQWVLAGVIHGGKLELFNPSSVELKATVVDEVKTLTIPATEEFWRLYDRNSTTSFERIGKLNTTLYAKAFGELGLDQYAPLTGDLRIEHFQFGILTSVQSNLASPEIHRAVRAQIQAIRRLQGR